MKTNLKLKFIFPLVSTMLVMNICPLPITAAVDESDIEEENIRSNTLKLIFNVVEVGIEDLTNIIKLTWADGTEDEEEIEAKEGVSETLTVHVEKGSEFDAGVDAGEFTSQKIALLLEMDEASSGYVLCRQCEYSR